MDKTYQPRHIETFWYKKWERENYFSPQGEGDPYTIVIPPPNVTGTLHMGHGFNSTIMDVLIRFRRMQGRSTLWQHGTDHAGIATQLLVERKLEADGYNRHDLGRDDFVKKIWQWKEQSGDAINRQIRRLGASIDWSRECFTMDEGLSEAVKEAFIRLYNDNLIYQGIRLVNWDTKLNTAISDLEVEYHDEKTSLWNIRYPLLNREKTSDGMSYLVIATTRPETMLGDVAIAVHPHDDRYKSVIGKLVEVPLVGRCIPIVSDDFCNPSLGTGCVKITPGHDFNDYEVGKRLGLPIFSIFDKEMRVLPRIKSYNINGDEDQDTSYSLKKEYVGLDRFELRKEILSDLTKTGDLLDVKEHTSKIPRGDRSGTIIEPLLTKQWYVSSKILAEKAIKAVEKKEIEFIPSQYENMYFSWMRNIQDWCISRQLWWGHRIPAWYDQQGNVYVGYDEKDVRIKYNISSRSVLRQEEDVLDTWFSSSLWTFASLGWPKEVDTLSKFHPTQVLVTGFDIIFFWVARMIMLTLHLIKDKEGIPQVPFKKVYVHGLVRDKNGIKMSKSKGNVLDPLDIIDGIELKDLIIKRTTSLMRPKLAERIKKETSQEYPLGIKAYGTDALRFTFCSLAATGRDIKFDMKRVEGYRNFCNKLWNAARYVISVNQSSNSILKSRLNTSKLSTVDSWIVSRLQRAKIDITSHLDNFRFDLAAQVLYEFVWNQYCNWYLELSKSLLSNKDITEESKENTLKTLVHVMEELLRLTHPFMPFITEEIWKRIAPLTNKCNKKSIMIQPWPIPDSDLINLSVESDIEWLKGLILGVRNIRGETNISSAKFIKLYIRNLCPKNLERFQRYKKLFKNLSRVNKVILLPRSNPETEIPSPVLTKIVGEIEILMPIEGADIEVQSKLLKVKIAKLSNEIVKIKERLKIAKLSGKTPENIIQKNYLVLSNLEMTRDNQMKQYNNFLNIFKE